LSKSFTESSGEAFARVALHHRPLAAVIALSAEMARRLAESPISDRFYQSP
jgi:hypothetical protein